MTRDSFEVDRHDVLTPREAARELGKSYSTIYNWIKTGKLPSYPSTDGQIFVLKSDLKRFTKVTLKRNPEVTEVQG